MATSVFEALFHGDDSYDVEPDPGAILLWFSDDPSLNEQTRFRLLEASDRLNFSDLVVVVQNTFNAEAFTPGNVYFVNTQKLGRNSLLTRGHDAYAEAAAHGQDTLAAELGGALLTDDHRLVNAPGFPTNVRALTLDRS